MASVFVRAHNEHAQHATHAHVAAQSLTSLTVALGLLAAVERAESPRRRRRGGSLTFVWYWRVRQPLEAELQAVHDTVHQCVARD